MLGNAACAHDVAISGHFRDAGEHPGHHETAEKALRHLGGNRHVNAHPRDKHQHLKRHPNQGTGDDADGPDDAQVEDKTGEQSGHHTGQDAHGRDHADGRGRDFQHVNQVVRGDGDQPEGHGQWCPHRRCQAQGRRVGVNLENLGQRFAFGAVGQVDRRQQRRGQ